MSMDAKYIVYFDPESGEETPIIFPEWVKHSHVAEWVTHSHVAARLSRLRPLAAGFVCLTDSGFQVYGESLSLGGVKSRGDEDAKLITRMFR